MATEMKPNSSSNNSSCRSTRSSCSATANPNNCPTQPKQLLDDINNNTNNTATAGPTNASAANAIKSAKSSNNLHPPARQHQHQQQQQQQQHQQPPHRYQEHSGAMSTPASPKAKSAPATPCNITPTAFHQHTSHLSSLLNPSPANTLPPDIRKNISATCRVLPSSIGRQPIQAITTQTIHHQQAALALPPTPVPGSNSPGSTAPTTTAQPPTTATPSSASSANATSQPQQNVTQPTTLMQPVTPTSQMLRASSASPNASSMVSIQVSASTSNGHTMVNSQYLDDLIKQGEIALTSKDYMEAIRCFSKCIELAKNNLPEKQNVAYLENFKIYSQRAEAHFNLRNYNEAIEDSMAARDLNPKWTQAYYLQGQAQFLLGQFADSLAVFSFGLAQDPSNKRLFDVLVDSALKSNFKQDFEPKFKSLKALDFDKKPFVVVSVLGQELLAKGHSEHAAIILESALKMGPDNKRFKGSVLSTITLAYCLLKDYEKAISYMKKELEVEIELEDAGGQCRVLSNLGYTYYKLRKFDKSLEAHRRQLNLAMKTHLFQQASVALNALGHVHAARNDYLNALTSHTRCLDILKQLGDNPLSQYRELISIGHIHSMQGDFKAAEEKYNEAISLLRGQANGKISSEELQVGLIMVKFNVAYLALKKRSYQEAVQYYSEIMELAQKIPHPKGTLYEMRAANGMGHTYRLLKEFGKAKCWFEKQHQFAQMLEDEVGQSQALCNLGMTYQHFKDLKSAWGLFDKNMRLVERGNPLLKAYAHSYIASMYFLSGRYSDAQTHYESSSNLFKELDYCSAERKTIDLNMALVYERIAQLELDAGPPVPPPAANNVSSSINQTATQKKVMMASS